ncbi:MAG: 4Fe-4S binding protein [Archaeoglobaceae archaeon]
MIVDGKIDYEFCKGCGICKEICKQKAIRMVLE